MKTKISQNDIKEEWFLVDAAGLRIGLIASKVAELLLGKTDPMVKANLDPKKHVVVVNADKVL
jgi:large subunit ribosomal protein L13